MTPPHLHRVSFAGVGGAAPPSAPTLAFASLERAIAALGEEVARNTKANRKAQLERLLIRPTFSVASSGSGVRRALREAVCNAFGASVVESRISLNVPLPLLARDICEPLRSRLRLHRLISAVRQEDFYAEADDNGRTILRPAEGAEVAKGMSFFAVLSSDPDVIAAVHAYLRPSLRNLGCCVRTLDELPPHTELVFDSVQLSTASDDAHIIVHASLVPSARVRMLAFESALEDRPARKCAIAGHAGVDLERESGGSGSSDACSVRTGDFEPDEA
jgi:hypothetical protein